MIMGGAPHPPTIQAAYDAAAGYVNQVPTTEMVAAVQEAEHTGDGDLLKRIAELERQLKKGAGGGTASRGAKGKEGAKGNPDFGKTCFSAKSQITSQGTADSSLRSWRRTGRTRQQLRVGSRSHGIPWMTTTRRT